MATTHEVLKVHFADLEQQHHAATLGMWIFLATELLLFGGLFTGYTVYRTVYPQEFEAASRHLNVVYGTINTIVLLTSSLTMALAVYGAHAGRQRLMFGCLIATICLGALFLGIKALEYYSDYQDELMPGVAFNEQTWLTMGLNPQRIKLFLWIYYVMTGLHALHLIAGLSILTVLAVWAARGRFSPEYYSPVEVGGL